MRSHYKFHDEMPPPDKLDTQVPDEQCGARSQLITSLLRFRSGWFAPPEKLAMQVIGLERGGSSES